ncbi:hypothetical protein H6795_02205 [Candidatus Nomurabacteria bacterium]|nr:hypothetical protein [Candidatus Nomurabacteria bacterium]
MRTDISSFVATRIPLVDCRILALAVMSPVTPSVPPMVALLVTLRPVPVPVALSPPLAVSPPLKVDAVAVLAPLPVTVARVSASENEVRHVAVVQTVPLVGRVKLVAPVVVKNHPPHLTLCRH